jgi:hypothetical protein
VQARSASTPRGPLTSDEQSDHPGNDQLSAREGRRGVQRVVARSSTRASESKPSRVSHQRRSQEEQLWRATGSPLTTISITTSSLVWQLGHFIRTCSLSRLVLSADHSRVTRARTRRTATDSIGRSMQAPLAVRRRCRLDFAFWLSLLVSSVGLAQRMAVSRSAEARRLRAGCSGPPSSPELSPAGPPPTGPLWPSELSSPPVPATKWAPLRSTQNQPLGTLRLSA